MTLQEAIAALIAAAVAAGASPDEVLATLISSWPTDTGTPARPKLDQWGRMQVQGRWMFAPFPIAEKWEGLTELQVGHMRVNCSVDALGRWKYEKDGKTVYVPSAFSGFSGDGPVAMYSATKFKIAPNDDGTTRWVKDGSGYFDEPTIKTRFGSLAEAIGFKFQDHPAA